ncbi:phosphate ABC transporter substrate-binding/OmpA family protein [Sulfitobacter guttiformis]|uniref:Phosphate ABC transporter substrate-binding protein (PhoT family) n=1 Tax=Sulfitobacter guttiformis TaxID=74349 RepID=A0A420DRV1_9RHOB|nr:phosphate ABC transporter substrate-binding/OmpA family protein [Sulfitobacter guttiformis]KIN74378.1 OmpA domain protein [Sulfitobacter guttiformis KCTC 32187]RKE96975.1 phosphate ABC transporter substrate-binding protein (PhoT family) [Sulfitobacter guttiformis]
MIKSIGAALLAALFLFGTVLSVKAQDVTLTSRDSKVELSGMLLGFDGEFYRLATDYGELTIDGSGVLCDGPGCPDLQDYVAELSISGASTLGAVVMPALIESFAQKNDYLTEREEGDDLGTFTYLIRRADDGKLAARFRFRVTNTDEGFADLLADEADIVMSLREIRPDERVRARETGMGDMTGINRSRVLALDAIVPVVSGTNPVRGISPADLAQVLAGHITNWKALGGPDVPIDLHLPDDASGLGQAIVDQLLRPTSLETFTQTAMRHPTPEALAEAVASDTFALGLTSYADRGGTQALMLTGACGFSMEASRRTIKTEDYPLTAPMFLYFPARRLPQLAREFLAFTREPAAQIVIRRSGFVDQTPEEIAVEEQGNRFTNAIAQAGGEITLGELQRMTSTLVPMARLSTSFRFEAGSIRLDAQSRSNVQQLARALEVGQYDARSLLFVGFSDGNGAAEANREIALRRADAVRRAVSEAAVTANLERVDLGVDAFGEAMPMACDDSSWGRQANRRVEVWVR